METGEMHKLWPEYVTMSRRPGIGSKWFDQYQSDVYPKDFTTVRGKKIKPPKYYDRLLENVDPELRITIHTFMFICTSMITIFATMKITNARKGGKNLCPRTH